MSKQQEQEIAKRRTFGIISHPDAGKPPLRKSSSSMVVQSIWQVL